MIHENIFSKTLPTPRKINQNSINSYLTLNGTNLKTMDTKINIPVSDSLLKKAMRVTQQKSKTTAAAAALVKKALQELIKKEETRQEALRMQGIGWGWNEEETRERLKG